MTLSLKNQKGTNISILSIFLSQLNENVISPNRSRQLVVRDDVTKTANVEQCDNSIVWPSPHLQMGVWSLQILNNEGETFEKNSVLMGTEG